MANKKAYEFDGVSIGFIGASPLGDSIMYKKVFEALAVLEPNCKIDVICDSERSRENANAFYSTHKNFNCVSMKDQFFGQEVKKYDLVLGVSPIAIIFYFVNNERLAQMSPKLFQSLIKVEEYNRQYIHGRDFFGRILFQMARARIFKTNRYSFMSCGGALPIFDDKVEINLLTEWKSEFDKLGLKKYITIGSNELQKVRHLVKQWPTRYYVELISLLKVAMPNIEVVQIGGGGQNALVTRIFGS